MIPNFLTDVYVDGPYRIGKQQGPFSDPNYYLIQSFGWSESLKQDVEALIGKYPTKDLALVALAERVKP